MKALFLKIVSSLTLVFITLVICFGIGEIVCRVYFPDTRLKYVDHPRTLMRFAPNQTGMVYLGNGDRSPMMQINELGLRGPEITKYAEQPIVLLGDSFAFGWGVNDNETLDHYLEMILQKKDSVINAGVPGFGVHQMSAIYDEIRTQFKPSNVVLLLWEGSLVRKPLSTEERKEFFEKSRVVKLLKDFSVFGTHIYRMLETLLLKYGKREWVISVNKDSVNEKDEKKQIWQKYMDGVLDNLPRLSELNEKIIEDSRDKLKIVFWPSQYFVEEKVPGLSEEIEKQLQEFCKAQGIKFVSLRDRFKIESSKQLALPVDSHPTGYAFCLAAKEIIEIISGPSVENAALIECRG